MKSNKRRKKEGRKQPNQKTNPPMITSSIKYTKRKKQKKEQKNPDRQNPRTNSKSKAIQTESHKEASIYTLTKREKGNEKSIYYKKKKRGREQPNQ